MKPCGVVSRAELMAMPAGVIFARYQPFVLEDPHIKGATWDVDFLECDLLPVPSSGPGVGIIYVDHDLYGREGLFDDEQLYVVYSADALESIIKACSEALLVTPK